MYQISKKLLTTSFLSLLLILGYHHVNAKPAHSKHKKTTKNLHKQQDDNSIDEVAYKAYAKDFDVSYKEAKRRISISNQSDEIVQKISALYDEDNISSLYFTDENGFGVAVHLVGNVSSKITELSLSNGETIKIYITDNAKYTSQQIQDYISQNYPKLASEIENFVNAGYDIANDSIIISIKEPEASDNPPSPIEEEIILNKAKAVFPDFNIRIKYSSPVYLL